MAGCFKTLHADAFVLSLEMTYRELLTQELLDGHSFDTRYEAIICTHICMCT